MSFELTVTYSQEVTLLFFSFFFSCLNISRILILKFRFFFSLLKWRQIRLKINVARELARSQSATHLQKRRISAPCDILSALSEVQSHKNYKS
jgi:hypothetical protein